MQDPRIILGIESSCDDTAAAIVTAERQILSTVVWEQDTLHADFGGVVPEVAARAHAERIDDCVAAALDHSGLTLADVSLVAVTAGPGLIGGVFAGVMFAKGLAAASGIDLVAVNHLAGHALTPRLTDNVAFPYLMLLVSGGHCQFLAVEGARRFTRLGGTIDDAPGEAFDKIARLLGLPQPGGPAIERAAAAGEPTRFALPRPLLTRPGCDMSFSGLKTATRREIDGLVARQGGLYRQDVADICAGFQAAVAEILTSRTQSALAMFAERLNRRPHVLAVAGGVAANATIRQGLAGAAGDVPFIAPPVALCTDNGAMIAWAGFEAHSDGQRDDLGFEARPRWPLDTDAAPILGSGKRGPKA